MVVALAGEHDLDTRDSVREAIQGGLVAGDAVVVDLQQADFVDSVVAAVFLEARKDARQRGLGFAVVLSDSPANEVRRMFDLSELTSIFAVYPTRDAALASMQGGFVEP